MANVHLVKLEEVPDMPRWVELSREAGHVSGEKAREWYIKIDAWQLWLELNQDPGH